MSNLDLAWAAGFFDGEGNVYCGRLQLKISISQTDREVLDRFRAAVQAGKVAGPRPGRQQNQRPYYVYQASSYDTIEVYEKLSPFLSTVKKLQFEEMIKRFKDAPIVRRGPYKAKESD